MVNNSRKQKAQNEEKIIIIINDNKITILFIYLRYMLEVTQSTVYTEEVLKASTALAVERIIRSVCMSICHVVASHSWGIAIAPG